MEDLRKQAAHTAKALSEQSRGTKQLESASRQVALLASQVTTAASEQAKAAAALVAGGEETRRSAKQAARALEEQAEAIAATAAHAAKQTTAFSSVARATVEQGAASEQLGRSVEEIRQRTREIVNVASQQAKRAVTISTELRGIADQTMQASEENAQHIAVMTRLAAPADETGGPA
jgi:methyl-accepting chemotaxis protein